MLTDMSKPYKEWAILTRNCSRSIEPHYRNENTTVPLTLCSLPTSISLAFNAPTVDFAAGGISR